MSDDKKKVGFGRPPAKTRFQPGRSGNPKGRPKGSKNFRTALADELSSTVPVTEQGKRRKLTKRSVIAKQMVNAALAGELKILPMILNADRADEQKQAIAAAAEEFPITPEDEAVMKDIVARILAAHSSGLPATDANQAGSRQEKAEEGKRPDAKS